MGRSPCCEKVGMKKGPWTPEEDQKLLAYIEEHGHGSWRVLPAKAGLERCGKSCRLRWTNYLRPDIKRGKFSLQEEQTIIQLHALLGNRWSAIATHLPDRTDNEIKNYWNTRLKKRLAKMGIDPVTHKPKNDALISINGHTKNASKLSHMAQWESARLEAEARLVRESKLRSKFSSSSNVVKSLTNNGSIEFGLNIGIGSDMESPAQMIDAMSGRHDKDENLIIMIEFVGIDSGDSSVAGINENMTTSIDHCGAWTRESMRGKNNTNLHGHGHIMEEEEEEEEGFTNLLLSDHPIGRSVELCDSANKESGSSEGNGSGGSEDCYEDNNNYWSSILNLVNSSPSDLPMLRSSVRIYMI